MPVDDLITYIDTRGSAESRTRRDELSTILSYLSDNDISWVFEECDSNLDYAEEEKSRVLHLLSRNKPDQSYQVESLLSLLQWQWQWSQFKALLEELGYEAS